MDLHYLAKNPFQQFHDWFKDAEARSGQEFPGAMALATVGESGQPSVRMVLLKSVSADGFVFFTNYESRKGLELAANPLASLCFYWDKTSRQIRVEGAVEKVSRMESEIYFHSRPVLSQIGAWASPQSQEIPSRDFLEKRVEEYGDRFRGQEVPLPDFWGGFLLRPSHFEFWQMGEGRLHDRFVYERDGAEWRVARLAP